MKLGNILKNSIKPGQILKKKLETIEKLGKTGNYSVKIGKNSGKFDNFVKIGKIRKNSVQLQKNWIKLSKTR